MKQEEAPTFHKRPITPQPRTNEIPRHPQSTTTYHISYPHHSCSASGHLLELQPYLDTGMLKRAVPKHATNQEKDQ